MAELKDKYGGHHGFVFLNSNSSSDRSIENLANTLKNEGFTRDLPILVTRLKQGIAFVYESMDGPRFWQTAGHMGDFAGIQVVPLCFFLKEVKE